MESRIQSAGPREERKIVSVVFVDLVDFVRRGEQLDPEDLRSLLAPYYARLRTELERFGGTVEKFIGDAVMAVFGAPVAHEDDAERAVRAGLLILEAIEELNEAHPQTELAVRAAVTTGEALVALGSRPELGEGMVTGDVVNMASRLQQAGRAGVLVVDEATYRVTRDVVDYAPLEPISVKGKAAPIAIWAAKSVRSRLEREDVSPLVGREHELALLAESYARALREPSVQLVTLVGEPGVGKSRLLAEFRAQVAEESGVWLQGRCLSYGEGITFWALGEIVKSLAGVLESDSPEVASDKLAAAVRDVVQEASERDWFHARLAPLVGADTAEAAGAVESSQSYTAWRRFFEAMATSQPLLLSLEDLHWADDALLDFVEHLVDWATDVPLLVVCTTRPELYERRTGWGGGKRNSTTAMLAPLTSEETAQLIGALLSQAVLPADTQQALLERAGGNPLYAEEFVRMLGDRGILEQRGRVVEIAADAAIPVPETIQALIAARLDTLSPDRKALLQAAAVVGKTFWAGAAASVAGLAEDGVEQALHELATKELVRRVRTSAVEGDDEYTFWHVLVRDVAYRQIPRAGRAEQHRAAAEWIERIAGARVTDHAEMLAHHYEQALELARAGGADAGELEEQTRRFLVLAGDRALPLDVAKAQAYYRRALELLPPDDVARPTVLFNAAEAAWLGGHWEEAETGYLEAIADFKTNQDNVAAGEALVRLARMVRDRGEPARAEALLSEAVEVLEREPPGPELILAYTQLSRYHHFLSHRDEGLEWARKAMDAASRLGSEHLGMRALQYRGYIRFELGDLGGVDDVREALRIGLEAGLGEDTVSAYINVGDLTWFTEGPAAGLELFRTGSDFAESRGFAALAMWSKAGSLWTLFELGDWDAVLPAAREIVAWDPSSYMALLVLSYEAQARFQRGDLPGAVALTEEFLPRARAHRDPQVLVPALTTAAQIEAGRGDLPAAVALIEELAEETGDQVIWRAHQLSSALRVCLATGATPLAENLVDSSIEHPAARFRHSMQAARAVLAEAQGAFDHAAAEYGDVAERWAEYGFVLEQAHALHGAGRCLLALGRRQEAAEPLHRACASFEQLGARRLAHEASAAVAQPRLA